MAINARPLAWIGALLIAIVLAAPGRAQTSQYPYYQIRDLEQSILANMREEAEDMQEIYNTLGWLPFFLVGGELVGAFKSIEEITKLIEQCHNTEETTNIVGKIKRVLYLQQTIPQQIGTLRSLSPGDARSLLNSRSYTSLQKKIRHLEMMAPTSPPKSCSQRTTQPPPQPSGQCGPGQYADQFFLQRGYLWCRSRGPRQ